MYTLFLFYKYNQVRFEPYKISAIWSAYGRILKMFSANRIGCDNFKQKTITLPPLIRSQLELKLRTIEPQFQNYWFLYKKACIDIYIRYGIASFAFSLLMHFLNVQSI